MRVRPANIDDAYGIAKVHVLTWRTAYAGIVPESYLRRLSIKRRESRLREELSDDNSESSYLVAESGTGDIVGMAVAGPSREPDLSYVGELHAIYVLDEYQGKGVGKALFKAAISSLVDRGCRSMLLWVLSDNTATAFYEGMGGRVVNSKTMEIGGATLNGVCYAWPDLQSITR